MWEKLRNEEIYQDIKGNGNGNIKLFCVSVLRNKT